MFFRLTGEWSALIAKWTHTERPFLRAPYHRVGRMSLATRIRVTALCLFLMCAGADATATDISVGLYMPVLYSVALTGDSVISTTQSIVNYRVRVAHCHWPDSNHLQRYFTMENMFIFKHIRYSLTLAIVKTVSECLTLSECE